MRRRPGNQICSHWLFKKTARRFDGFISELPLEKRRRSVDQRLRKQSLRSHLEQRNRNTAFVQQRRLRGNFAERRGRAYCSNSAGSAEKIDRSIFGWFGPSRDFAIQLGPLGTSCFPGGRGPRSVEPRSGRSTPASLRKRRCGERRG